MEYIGGFDGKSPFICTSGFFLFDETFIHLWSLHKSLTELSCVSGLDIKTLNIDIVRFKKWFWIGRCMENGFTSLCAYNIKGRGLKNKEKHWKVYSKKKRKDTFSKFRFYVCNRHMLFPIGLGKGDKYHIPVGCVNVEKGIPLPPFTPESLFCPKYFSNQFWWTSQFIEN